MNKTCSKLVSTYAFLAKSNSKCSLMCVYICLLAELFLAQLVQRVELFGQRQILLKAATGQLHANYDCPVWDHHRYRSKVDLQVLWQFLSTCVTRILQT